MINKGCNIAIGRKCNKCKNKDKHMYEENNPCNKCIVRENNQWKFLEFVQEYKK